MCRYAGQRLSVYIQPGNERSVNALSVELHQLRSSANMTTRGLGWARRNTSNMRVCSYAVAAFIDRLAKCASKPGLSSLGSSSRELESPRITESNCGLRASAGKE